MRIAWMGPAPTLEGGVPYLSTQLLRGLARAGVEVDCFVEGRPSDVPDVLQDVAGLRFCFAKAGGWEWDRWYSRTPLSQFVSGQTSRALLQRRLLDLLVEQHAARPYGALYRFSQIELFVPRRLRGRLPKLVVHPETHAAGELRWHRRETRLARTCEPLPWHLAVRAMLVSRAARQKRDIARASLVLAVSNRFADHLRQDYGVPPQRLRVAANFVDLDRFAPAPDGAARPDGPLVLVFVARMSVRKGVEMVVDLSHRLADLEGKVRIEVVGDRSQWSDYRCVLEGANKGLLSYRGPLPAAELPPLYRAAHAAMLPSHFEPCAITQAEALACGLPIVVSDEVEARHGIDPRCCYVFPAGNKAAFEAAVRRVVALDAGQRLDAGSMARQEAVRLFDPAKTSAKIAGYLAEV